MKIPNISALRTKFKNRLDAPESILLRGSHLKFEPIRPGLWGGAVDFVPSTSCISCQVRLFSFEITKLIFNLIITLLKIIYCVRPFDQICLLFIFTERIHDYSNKELSFAVKLFHYRISIGVTMTYQS